MLRHLILAAAGSLLAIAPAQAQAQAADPDDGASVVLPALKGSVGVCVRWGVDERRVAEAVVVRPSGNAVLDQTLPQTIPSLPWARPSGYDGGWVGANVSVDGAPTSGKNPDCSGLRASEPVSAPTPKPNPPIAA